MWVSNVKATIKSRTKEARPVPCNVISFIWVALCLVCCCFCVRFSWTCLNSKKRRQKCRQQRLSLLSNQWISYGSWMLFKQIFTARFLLYSYSTFSFHSALNFTFAFRIFDRHNIIEYFSSKIIQHILRLFGNSGAKRAEKWIESPVFQMKPSWVFQLKASPELYDKMDTKRNVFICFIVMSFLADGIEYFLGRLNLMCFWIIHF